MSTTTQVNRRRHKTSKILILLRGKSGETLFIHNNKWHISLEWAWIGRDEAKTTSGMMESVCLGVISVQTFGIPVVLPEDFLGAPHELTSTHP